MFSGQSQTSLLVTFLSTTFFHSQAVAFIDHESSFSDEEKGQAKALEVICNLNNAACKLKLKEYKEAKNLCNKVLEIDVNNVKALYRRAHANIFLVELESAELDVKKVLELNPDNRLDTSGSSRFCLDYRYI